MRPMKMTDSGSLTTMGSTYEIMHTFSRRAKFTLLSLYVAMGMLVGLEYLRYTQTTQVVREMSSSDGAIRYGAYCVLPHIVSTPIVDHNRIGLALHISADFLDKMLQVQVERWSAPVSLTVVMDRPQQQFPCVLEFMKELQARSKVAAENLRVHVLFNASGTNCTRRELEGRCVKKRELLSGEVVKPGEHVVKDLGPVSEKEEEETRRSAAYPVNVARNIARMHVGTRYLLMGDYEHLFSENFEQRMRQLADEELSVHPQTVLVYRIFEVDQNVDHYPNTKAELRSLMLAGKAVVFHQSYAPGAHQVPGLNDWISKPEDFNRTRIAVTNLEFTRRTWEPQFVSLTDIPYHDERFPYGLRDNTELRWELCRKGYRFALVEDLFMYHMGIKRRGTDAAKRSLRIQKLNKPKFKSALKEFEARMERLYPTTKIRCPKFGA